MSRVLGSRGGVTALLLGLVVVGVRPCAAQTRFGVVEANPDSTWIDRAVYVRIRWAAVQEPHWALVVPARIEAVWSAWTDPSELELWAAPGAAVDLRVGGSWEVHFLPDRPPGQRGSDANEILGLEPGRRLRIAAGAPVKFPTVRAEKTLAIHRHAD